MPTTNSDQYFVLDRDGLSYERRAADRTFFQTVRDIIGGEFDSFGVVLRVNVVDGVCQDASADVANKVLLVLLEDGVPPRWNLLNWLEKHCGAGCTDSLVEEAM